MQPTITTGPMGIAYRDLNGNGVMDPYENPQLSVAERVDDLLPRLSLAEKVGLMFHTVIEAGTDGTVLEAPGQISKSGTSVAVVDKLINHFNIHDLTDARMAARWHNALQAVAERTPHGIPVTVSTDPRHGFLQNSGAGFAAAAFSQWPEPIGLAAINDVDAVAEFAGIARAEYTAVGIRAALHPTVDFATEPRWGRQAHTLGADSRTTSALVAAYLDGLQGETLGTTSVACTTKHFPGGGPQKDGEDAHFPYGREQVYPGGRFAEHLAPFRTAIEHHTAAVMPYYGMPVGLVVDGEAIEEVGFGYNRQILTVLLRDQLGYDGVVVTDWELVNDNVVGVQVLPARAWGVEDLDPLSRMQKVLDAGADQFGGEECVELLLELVATGRVSEQRIDESARRLLRVKFELGLFDDPYVDEDNAVATLGRPEFRESGHRAQARSVTVLKNDPSAGAGEPTLPLRPGTKVVLDRVDPDAVARHGLVPVDRAEDADLALVRLQAPWDQRNDLFLEAWFHQGSLDFPPGLVARLAVLAKRVPLVVDVFLDRPAILTPIEPLTAALTATFGCSDDAWLDALTGRIAPEGSLPFELPGSMAAVRAGQEDVPGGTHDPLYMYGHGLSLE